MAWTDLSAAFGYGTKLTSQQQQQLRDNIKAAFDGDADAPVLLTHPIWRGGEVEHENSGQTYADYAVTVFRKKAGMETVRLYARVKRTGSTKTKIRYRVSTSYSTEVTSVSNTYELKDCGTIDVSGFSNDTNYEMAIQICKGDSDAGNARLFGFAVFVE